jgi:hypothetical protein
MKLKKNTKEIVLKSQRAEVKRGKNVNPAPWVHKTADWVQIEKEKQEKEKNWA